MKSKSTPALFVLGIGLLTSFFLLKNGQGTSSGDDQEISQILATQNTNERVVWYKKLLARVGPEEAQEGLFRSGLPFTGETHLLNHTTGDYIYQKYGLGGLVHCKDYFLESCYHGFVLHAISDHGLEALTEIMNSCWANGGTRIVTQCAHAIGHGLLTWVGYANLTKALSLCDQVGNKAANFPLLNCHDGVFMENLFGVHLGKPSPDRWIKNDDPFYPCNDPRIAEKYHQACWMEQASVMFQMFQGDIAKVGNECLKVKNSTYQSTCFNSLNRQIHPITNGNASEISRLCNLLPAEWVNDCIFTNVESYVAVGDRTVPFQVCSQIDEGPKSSCYERLLGMLSVYAKPGEKLELCAKISDQYWQERCLQSLQ